MKKFTLLILINLLLELISIPIVTASQTTRVIFSTRSGYYLNCYDSKGVCQAQPTYSDDPNVSDEIFTVYKVRGSSGGNQIKSGDKIMIKTRRNYAFNCYDSRGTCKAIPTFSDDYRISDEVFTIRFL
jgi:hypothetical protein